ncbi:helix-turn-helix domain-containing protein [Nonlabens sp. Ci31]|jgi:transcriptional regulator with XRE-family HTH domain|uniref:helix-turn-helix domain-containing protein n=1 Tax=Nonlabens sp. Ci31 TaxID=2608253 RepID=UPI00146377CD|nr:helix-turn-helix transcriptional regulator [Nonlabens sp. Ci31]QJP35579.1 helix-turn-helix domain-containing protein [Nonlabens sp. Ci31]
MVNSADFSKRMQKIMDRNDLNASSFAERIHVGRSSISHILSGRNKPSLDFVINTVKEFPEVDFDWLLNGKGTYPRSETPQTLPTENTSPTAIPEKKAMESSRSEPMQTASQDLFSTPDHKETNHIPKINKGKNIQKVILLYDDGSFEYFIP